MKRILCYGDSNTWGCDPNTGMRYEERYTKILSSLLGNGYEVIEEGLPGRTTVYDTDVDLFVNGRTYLYPCLTSHMPLDFVIIMLGTNDLSTGVHANAYYAAAGVERLVNTVRHWSIDWRIACPHILIISPPIFGTAPSSNPAMEQVFDFPYAALESSKFRRFYEDVANTTGCSFLSAEDYTTVGCDGVHLTKESHRNLATAIMQIVQRQSV